MKINLFDRGVFEPEAVQTLQKAYIEACHALRLHDDTAREKIARRIISLARSGEDDAGMIRDRIDAGG